MSFAWPLLLLLLVLPPALFTAGVLRRGGGSTSLDGLPSAIHGRAGARLFTPQDTQRRSATRSRTRLWMPLTLAFGIVALARPQWGLIEEKVFERSREILVALDLSRSMLAQDVKPSRLDRARLLTRSLVDRLQGERVGLVVFAGTAFLQSPLSTDYEILRDLLPELNPGFLPEGGTNYDAMITTALEAFGGEAAADRFLIVLSDGEDLDESWTRHLPELTKRNVRVLGLGIGTSAGSMITDENGNLVKDERGAVVLSKLQSETLSQMASGTKGVYRDASTWVDLPALLKQTVDAGKKGDFTDKRVERKIDRYQWPLAASLVCAFFSLLFEFPVRIRPRRLGMAGAATVSLLLLLLASPDTLSAAPADTRKETPLVGTVRRLSSAPTLAASDCKQLASDTLAWGKDLKGSGQPIPPGAIRDGLDAVSLGSSLDASAANWAALRRELESLLQSKDPQQQDKQPPQQDQDKNKDQDQDKNDKSDDKDKQQDSQQKKPDKASDKDKPSKSGDSQPGPDESQKDKAGEQDPLKAFDSKQKEEPPPKPPQPSPQEMQQVGGEQKNNTAPQDPNLVVPMEKLEKLKETDSPGRLFQLMEGDKNKKQTGSPKKNW